MSDELEKDEVIEEKKKSENDEKQGAEIAELKNAVNRLLNELDAVRKDVAEMRARQDDEEDDVVYEGTQY